MPQVSHTPSCIQKEAHSICFHGHRLGVGDVDRLPGLLCDFTLEILRITVF